VEEKCHESHGCRHIAYIFCKHVRTNPTDPQRSTVYIEPMGGYETYLAAAMVKMHVPLVVMVDKAKAEYIIQSTVSRMCEYPAGSG